MRRFAGDRTIEAQTTLDELGLSSLERLELLMALEEQFEATIDEFAFSAARTVGDLRGLVDRGGGPAAPAGKCHDDDAELLDQAVGRGQGCLLRGRVASRDLLASLPDRRSMNVERGGPLSPPGAGGEQAEHTQ